ncbi:hypothetical protein EMEDMD4_710003 [Sinorhizobium medicae]|uniref:Uncharacterized protein n=1 Tax=Sinorhizobium medicae TaxID=110321 RepID=A0A508X532_9HYPH|nr:hypothetical protein EMEDMD4_710003 [Sinorhizobium medicae]
MLLSWKIGNRQVARYRWKGFGTSDLFDTPDFPGTNKQIEENRAKTQTSPECRCSDQLAATTCRWSSTGLFSGIMRPRQ